MAKIKRPKASIIIPTLNRPGSLAKCLESINNQTEKDYEVILVSEEGALSKLRNDGAKRAKGDYFIFIDDDVITTPDWLKEIITSFEKDRFIGGVSGPAVIPETFRSNRDIFSHRRIKRLYDLWFCRGKQYLPGHIMPSGAWTTGACMESCNYEGEVDFLEACNMAYERNTFNILGGFDEGYKGVGDWSEPDLAYRVRKMGKNLWFNPKAKLYHYPSQSGAFKKRKADAKNRLENYEKFSKRWLKQTLEHKLYKMFIRGYYGIKTIE